MATRIDYPSELPAPQTSTVSPAEMRQLSDQTRPYQARALSVEHREFERITFPAMTRLQADRFQGWWKDELYYGGAWFNATWPLPRGMVEAVRKFVGSPRWQAVGRGYWKISAVCEVRGRSVPVFRPDTLSYAWNDLTKIGTDPESLESYWTLTNGGATATVSNGYSIISSQHGLSVGDFYAEIRLNFAAPPVDPAFIAVGLSRGTDLLPADPIDTIAILLNGDVLVTGGTVGSVSALATNSVIGIAIETATGKVWLSVNGTWILGGDPSARTGHLAAFGNDEFYLGFSATDGIGGNFAATIRAFPPFAYEQPLDFYQWWDG